MRPPRLPRQFKRKKREDRRGRHTKEERLARIRAAKATIVNPTCRGCSSVLDSMRKTEEGDAVVCTTCGLVDNNTCFDLESPVYDYVPRSPFYKHRFYFAERLLQARNSEPRLTLRELDILSIVYDTYRDLCPLVWQESNFTKKHCGTICRLIKSQYPKSPFNRRIERWYQYRVYMCGPVSDEIPLHLSCKLRLFFDAYAEFFTIYLEETGITRKNITQLDLVILTFLYNFDYDYVRKYGWYFLNYNIVNKTPCVFKHREKIKTICKMINERILNYHSQNIRPNCYKWFREGNQLKVPSVDTILDMCLFSEMGVKQYVNYKKKNHVALLYYLDVIVKRPHVDVFIPSSQENNKSLL